MPWIRLRVAWAIAVLLSVAGCSGATPTSPPTPTPPASIVGSWSGPVVDAVSGHGTMQMTFSEPAPNTLAGTWSANFTNGHSFAGAAAASRSSSAGYAITLFVNPPTSCGDSSGSAPLGFTLINVAVTSSKLTAVAARTSCNGLSFGTLELSRQ